MTGEDRANPANWLDNYASWYAYFNDRRARQLAEHEGPPGAPLKRKNTAGRKRWWSVSGRTLAWVLGHIEAGNNPRLEYPAPPTCPSPSLSRRRGSSWMPRRMVGTSSSSSAATRSSGSAPAYSPPAYPPAYYSPPAYQSPLRPVKREASPPPRSGPRTRARGITINERRAPSPPRGLARPKKEPRSGGSALRKPKTEPGLRTPKLEPTTAEEEEYILKLAMEASLHDVPPAPPEVADAWSLEDWKH